MSKFIEIARQQLFPAAFRISDPAWPEDVLEALRKLTNSPPPPRPEEDDRLPFLAELGTGVWRLRQKMLEPGTDRPKESFRREYRHLESLWDLLVQTGLEIQDHTGHPFDSGQAIKVLAFQPTPGIGREQVQDTIKPTIYFKQQHIQMGEVIVASPEKNDGNPPASRETAPPNPSGESPSADDAGRPM